MNKKQSATVFIPITYLSAIWKINFEKIPKNKSYYLHIDYPLTNKTKFKINTGKNGMNIIQLFSKIGKLYQKIYSKEDQTLISESEDGCYGIYGHNIDDLSLQSIHIDHKMKKITLGIGS